jgi:outer membrane protein TolC
MAAAATHGALAGAQPAVTGVDPVPTPGLAGYERDALAHNPTLREKRLAIARADEELRAARAGYLPQIDVSARYTKLIRGGNDLGSLVNPVYAALNQLSGQARFPTDVQLHLPPAFEAKIELRQPVFAPAVWGAVRLAELGRSASQVEMVIAEREIASGVRAAYLAHARAGQVATLLEQSRPLFEENLRVSQRLVARDKQTSDAVFRAQAELAGHEQLILQVGEAKRAAARALNLLRGAPGDDPVQAPAELPVPKAMPKPLAAYLDRARRARAELRLADVGRAVAVEQRALVRTGFLPTVAVALDYGFERDDLSLRFDDDFASISVVAAWNVFDGRKDAHRSRARELDIAASDVQRRQLLDQIETEVRDTYGAAELAMRAVAAAEARVSSAQAAYNLIAKKYDVGVAPQIELIAARTALLQAGTDRITAVTDYHVRLLELDRVTESTGESR